MHAIETIATATEDLSVIKLTTPLPSRPDGDFRVIVLFDEKAPAAFPEVDWTAAIGSYYREHPDAPRMTTAEWMEETRGGEYED